ncbi:unnamed protein product [Spirodela intermedia]|uniref:endo-polygalacturonase n=1 Tax=Spirodela intermedia TaxID=51605 RepID=A0A7I8IT81_SPIIN|nr:unnamed protein product [Spirodela intermedia]CAA6661214.1 unnamed protein product [Spirodela intermedia]
MEDWRGEDESMAAWTGGRRVEDEVREEALGFEFLSWRSEDVGRIPVNVEAFGAVGDGIADDTQAFLSAWNRSCSLNNSVFLVPAGKSYLVRAVRFRGPCTDDLIIQISGTIVAPAEPEDWDPKNPRTWLHFSKLAGVRFQGDGVIDGSGSKWWASSCKINKTNPCRGAPTAAALPDSQQIHFTISRSDAVRVSDVQVAAPSNSPNTDGIHISESTNVVVQSSKIQTGDDCISIVNASSNIKMKNIDCGPGHGISIGSLGKDNSTAAVSTIVVDTAVLRGTTNGGGSGYVRAVRFQNVRMIDVQNPIIIDQFYCDSPTSCRNQTSAVKVSQVLYRNISGTTRTAKAMKFACSDTVPCSDIVLDNINLTAAASGGTAETFCNCAAGFATGVVQPAADCLRADSSPCDGSKETGRARIAHGSPTMSSDAPSPQTSGRPGEVHVANRESSCRGLDYSITYELFTRINIYIQKQLGKSEEFWVRFCRNTTGAS